ncbi:uncharacterized protein LOC131078521 [Cryptomeria japonica]|uniref:uncharacterized protein LOC131078521 n=1 Tax=Cryptomeria japonica TaxID=3369 RepID=UPI0027DA7681|nr:uncharacterized protein LOC131078521 [Cryptomeria japonica]
MQRTIETENDDNIELSETEENDTRQEETTKNKWEIISRLHHGQLMQTLEFEMLSRRYLDKETNWSTDYEGEEYTDKAMNFIATIKNIGSPIHDDIPQIVNYHNLSNQQEQALNIIISHYLIYGTKPPLFMIIQGMAGTGKSNLIGTINEALKNASMPNRSPLLVLVPTGVAAFNIGASTIHSRLRIPIRDFIDLQGTRLTTFQEEMAHVTYILIDEMSLIGERLLENIDARLRQAFPSNANENFTGDLGQLPPVNDRPPYNSRRQAKILWEQFTTIITLDHIYQQEGQGNDQERFRQLLMNIRDAKPALDDWILLMTRSSMTIDTTTNQEFDSCVHLFSTNDNVHNHNKKKLQSLKNPIAHSIASKVRNVSANESGMDDELDVELLLLSKNARVMLTSNLWIKAGLVNEALGNIRKIVYKLGSAPPQPPAYLLVEFDNYSGLPFDDHHTSSIPVPAIERGGSSQIPLRLAWALTIHKSQGLTLQKATIDIGPTERTGLMFVAISRMKSLQGLRIMSPFSYDRYEKLNKGKQVVGRKREEERLQSI